MLSRMYLTARDSYYLLVIARLGKFLQLTGRTRGSMHESISQARDGETEKPSFQAICAIFGR
jgi:hypothetical protein